MYLMIIAICKLVERRWVRRWRHVLLTYPWHLLNKHSLTTHHWRLYFMCDSLTIFLWFGLMEVKNLNNLQPEPTQLIPLWNSPHKYLLLVYISWTCMLVSLKPVLKHRYAESQPFALPTLCIVVSILITSNHPLSLVNFLDSNVYVQIFLSMNMR